VKIHNIRFKNINSLKGEFCIDFTIPPLSETGIFAILGPTGSGKTTILDAITLALFNRTPRTGSISKNNIEAYGAIITRNTDDCYAEIEYEVKNKCYRSKWEISRNRNGNLRDYEMELAHLPSNEILDLKKNRIPEANAEFIGLNYEQFVKSILLSQGEFARFLKSDANERGELLEKITGTEIYREIGKAAFEKYKLEKQKYDIIFAKAGTVKLYSNEEILKINEQINLFNNSLVQINKNITLFTQHILTKEKLEKFRKDELFTSSQLLKIKHDFESLKTRILKAEKHEKLLAIQNLITNWQHANKQISNTNEQKDKLILSIQESKEKLISMETILNRLSDEKNKLEQAFESQKPVLLQAREIQKNSFTQQQILNEWINQHKKLDSEITNQSLQIEQTQKNIQENEKKKQSIINWLSDNLLLNQLQKEFEVIRQEIANFLSAKASTEASFNDLTEHIRNKVFSTNSWKDRLSLLSTQFHFLLNEIELNNRSELLPSDRNKQNLDNLREKLRTLYGEIHKQHKLAVEFAEKTKEIEELKAKIPQIETEIGQFQLSRKKNENELEINQLLINELKIRVERQTLEAKYDEDRKLLRKDEPCFLCGSSKHPYVTNYQNELSQSKKDLIANEAVQKKLLSENQQLKTDIALIIPLLENTKTNYEKSVQSTKQLVSDFEAINQQLELAHTIEHPEKIMQTLEKMKTEGLKLSAQIELVDKLANLESEKMVVQTVLEKTERVTKSFESIQCYEECYQKYIPKGKSLEIWEIEFRKHLETLQVNSGLLQSSENLLSGLKSSFDEKYENIQKNKAFLANLTIEVSNQKKQIETLKAQLIELIGNKTPDEIEMEWSSLRDTKHKAINTCQLDTMQIKTQLTEQHKLYEHTENETLSLSSQKDSLEQELLPKINELGYEHVNQATDDIIPDKEYKEIKLQHNKLLQQNYSFEQDLIAIKKEIEELEKNDQSETSLNDARNNLEALNTEKDTLIPSIIRLETLLDENLSNVKLHESIQKETLKQETEYLRWEALAKLIGDAEGKKFTKFAQELTLVQLIALANNHLKMLNKRYILKKSETLTKEDLSVIDTYMGDAERSVQTLSGGETFLLSLALALGLSDLAGKNTRLESLFIDEGFGSLDQDTLDMALAAMETLQIETKRTIGVISHVPQLRERISTKIELVRSGAGYSTLKIVNN